MQSSLLLRLERELEDLTPGEFVEPDEDLDPQDQVVGPMTELMSRIYTLCRRYEVQSAELVSQAQGMDDPQARELYDESTVCDLLADMLYNLLCVHAITAYGKLSDRRGALDFKKGGFVVARIDPSFSDLPLLGDRWPISVN